MTIKIHIVDSVADFSRELNRKAMSGELKEPARGMAMTPETFSRVFSPERIKLLQRIHRNNFKSIYQLAKELGKPYEVVFRNLKYLEGMGIVRIASKDNRRVPSLDKSISIEMFQKADAAV